MTSAEVAARLRELSERAGRLRDESGGTDLVYLWIEVASESAEDGGHVYLDVRKLSRLRDEHAHLVGHPSGGAYHAALVSLLDEALGLLRGPKANHEAGHAPAEV